jgi:hypothetical protein
MDSQVYEYKGNRYMILGTLKVKHPDTGEWFNAIRYEDRNGQNYVRETDDFNNKFKVVTVDVLDEVIIKFTYKGFIGESKYYSTEECYHGKLITCGNDLVDFSGENISELKVAFAEAVDDYLDMLDQVKK